MTENLMTMIMNTHTKTQPMLKLISIGISYKHQIQMYMETNDHICNLSCSELSLEVLLKRSMGSDELDVCAISVHGATTSEKARSRKLMQCAPTG